MFFISLLISQAYFTPDSLAMWFFNILSLIGLLPDTFVYKNIAPSSDLFLGSDFRCQVSRILSVFVKICENTRFRPVWWKSTVENDDNA